MTFGRDRPGFVIAATGLEAEARIAARSTRVKTVTGGGDRARLAALIERAIADGGRAIASFGIAGGLSGELAAGDCVIAGEVARAGKLHRADTAWTARLARTLRPAAPARMAGTNEALSTPAQKEALRLATGAAAVDMESHVVAEIATRHGLPFAVIRVIADPAGRALPPAALAGMRRDGTTDIGACLRSLMRNPGQTPTLVAVAFDTAQAMRRLLRCVQLLGPGLGFFDRG